MIPNDEPKLIKNEKEWLSFFNELDGQENFSHLPDPPTNYPCFVYYYTDYSDWSGYYHELYCCYFYIEHARELYMTKFLGE